MFSTKNLTHKLFITILMVTTTSSHQLHAMNPTSSFTKVSEDRSLFSSGHPAVSVEALCEDWKPVEGRRTGPEINKNHYIKCEVCLSHPTLLLEFIKDRRNEGMDHISIANIVKDCLHLSGKSLSDIQDDWGATIFHHAIYTDSETIHTDLDRLTSLKILKLIAGNKTWNMICMRVNDMIDSALNVAIKSCSIDASIAHELLSTAPNLQAVWNFVTKPTKFNKKTTLSYVQSIPKEELKIDITAILESYCPEEQKADFQTYLALSTLKNNPEYYLPHDLVQLIATKVSQLIDKERYEKYGTCLNDPGVLLNFIQNKYDKSICHISTANIIKRCLRYGNKSLNEIKYADDSSIFICAITREVDNNTHIEVIKTLKLVAGKEAWNLICMQDSEKFTVLTWGILLDSSVINELFSAAPNSQAVWNLIITPDIYGHTVLDWAKDTENTDLKKLLESYRPKEQ